MNTTITGRHMDVTDGIRSYIEKKIERVHKFHNRISEIGIVLDGEKIQKRVEIICKVDHRGPFIVHETGEDMYACIDLAVDKMDRQLKRHKEKQSNHKGQAGAAEASVSFLETQEDKDES